MKSFFILVPVLILTGCASANVVQRKYEPHKGGVVKVHGGWFDSGGEKCQAAMRNFCSPEGFKVLSERYSGETVGMTANTYGNVTQVTPNNETFLYVHFRCDDSEQPPPPRHRRRTVSPQAAAPESTEREQCKSDCVSKVQSGEITDSKVCADACP